MKYSKKELAEELKKELEKGYNVERIANWASNLFDNSRGDFANEINEILRYIFLMDAGPEFEISEKKLQVLAENLIQDKENPLNHIKRNA